MYFNEDFDDILLELCLLHKNGLPNLTSEKSLFYLRERFSTKYPIEFVEEVISNLLEADKRFKNPDLNKIIDYTNVNGEKAQGMVGNLLRRPKEEDAHIQAVKALGGEESDRYRKAMDDLGSEGQPNRDIEKEREAGGEVGGEKSQTGTALNPTTSAGKLYTKQLPKNDPAYTGGDTDIRNEIFDTNIKNLNDFITNGFAGSEGAPGSAGSMLNEIGSISTATEIINDKINFDFDTQLRNFIVKLKDTALANENNGNLPATGVTVKEARGIADEYGISIGLASRCIIAIRAAESKFNHINDTIITKNNIKNYKSFPFFGDKVGLKSQENMINSISAKIMLGNTEITKEAAIEIVKSGGGGSNPSDTAIFVVDEDSGNLHMVFFSDKDNVNAIVAQSSLVAETNLKKSKIDKMVENGLVTEEDSVKIKSLMDESIISYQQLESDLDNIVKGPIIHLQNINPSDLITIAKTLSKGANPAKYWSGDKNVKGITEFMSKSKKHMKYLPDNHSTPPTDEEMMIGFIRYAADDNQLTKNEQRVLTDLSNKTNGPKLGSQIGEIRKKTINADLNLIKLLDEYKIDINGKLVGIGTVLEAESVSEKLHFDIMFGGDGVYMDSDAFYQESGGVKVNKQAMENCLPFTNKNDMISHFEVGEEREMTKRGSTTITGASKIVYAISKDGKRYPIGEKKQRSKTGELGKLQTVYNYHPELQKCFTKNQ
jgi:hypothetical protein